MEEQSAGARREFLHGLIHGIFLRADDHGLEDEGIVRQSSRHLQRLIERPPRPLRPKTLGVERVNHDTGMDGAAHGGILLGVHQAGEKTRGNHQ